MDSNRVYIFFWTLVSAVMISLIAGITAYNIHVSQAIEQLVREGGDPIKVSCALGRSSPKVCAKRASKP